MQDARFLCKDYRVKINIKPLPLNAGGVSISYKFYAFGPAFTMFSGIEVYFLKFSLNFFASSLADAS